MREGSPPESSPAKWIPSPFDVVKELNAHAGRLAPLLGLILAAASFSLANGPIHDALVSFDVSAHGFVYGTLILLGLVLYIGGHAVIAALNPALPSSIDDEQQWADLVDRKRSASTEAVIAISISMSSLAVAWVFAYSGIQPPPYVGTAALFVIPLLGIEFLRRAERLVQRFALLWQPRAPVKPLAQTTQIGTQTGPLKGLSAEPPQTPFVPVQTRPWWRFWRA